MQQLHVQVWRMDIFLQTGHQSQCCRIVRFHDSSNYSVFPSEGFGSEVIRHCLACSLSFLPMTSGCCKCGCSLVSAFVQASEVGPRSNKGGPCLVQLKDVRVTPSEFLSWFESSLLERYVTRIYWIDPGQRKTPAASEVRSLLYLLARLANKLPASQYVHAL